MARRALIPREHGAYFQLALPLATALVMHGTGIPSIAWAAAACLAFLAHEPLLILLGHRGRRLRSTEAPRARRALVVLGGAATVLGIVALALGGTPLLVAAAVSLVPAAILVVLAWRRREHTLFGELIAAMALTGAVVPVLAAKGTAPEAVCEIWLGWATGFATNVIAIHRVLARHKHPGTWVDVLLAISLLALTAASVVTLGWSMPSRLAAPLVALAAVLVIVGPSASRLRAIGIAIASAAAAAAIAMIVLG